VVGDEATSMFAGQPQPVEIHHRGIWYSGELIGWRHESGGRVSARVRCRIDKLRHSAWVDLGRLRLPDPDHPPRSEPYPAPLPRDAENPGQADATRPHAMLAALSSRPAKPAHATAPPAPENETSVHEPTGYGSSVYEEPTYESASESYGYDGTYETTVYESPAFETSWTDAPAYEPSASETSAYETSGSWADEPASAYEGTEQPEAAEQDWPFAARHRPRGNEHLRKRDAYLSVL
jgi:hypothetical protein